jgi:hypothetical protein
MNPPLTRNSRSDSEQLLAELTNLTRIQPQLPRGGPLGQQLPPDLIQPSDGSMDELIDSLFFFADDIIGQLHLLQGAPPVMQGMPSGMQGVVMGSMLGMHGLVHPREDAERAARDASVVTASAASATRWHIPITWPSSLRYIYGRTSRLTIRYFQSTKFSINAYLERGTCKNSKLELELELELELD